jgi:hypothetical protein
MLDVELKFSIWMGALGGFASSSLLDLLEFFFLFCTSLVYFLCTRLTPFYFFDRLLVLTKNYYLHIEKYVYQIVLMQFYVCCFRSLSLNYVKGTKALNVGHSN